MPSLGATGTQGFENDGRRVRAGLHGVMDGVEVRAPDWWCGSRGNRGGSLSTLGLRVTCLFRHG